MDQFALVQAAAVKSRLDAKLRFWHLTMGTLRLIKARKWLTNACCLAMGCAAFTIESLDRDLNSDRGQGRYVTHKIAIVGRFATVNFTGHCKSPVCSLIGFDQLPNGMAVHLCSRHPGSHLYVRSRLGQSVKA